MSLALKSIKMQKAAWQGGQHGLGIRQGATRFNPGMMYSRGRAGQGGGWFGDLLGNVVGGIPIVGGVLKAGVSVVDNALSKKKGGVAGQSVPQFAAPQTSGPGFGGMTMPSIAPPSPSYPTATIGGGTSVVPYKGCAPAGMHPNKSGYWKNQSGLLPGASWVEKGSILVPNRKRNPYNPRAASRAMSRLAALSVGMKTLEKQLTKLAPRRPSTRSKCGCSTKRK